LENGDPLDEDIANVNVVPGENFLQSLFSTLSLSIKGHEVEYDSNYPYRAYLETIVNYRSQAKNTHLSASHWFHDSLNALDTNQLTGAHCEDLNSRKTTISGCKTVDMVGQLHNELFSQHKYLIYSFV